MRTAAALLGGLLLAGLAPGTGGDDCARDFDVASAGWVTVDIGALAARCGPGRAVRGPDGERLPVYDAAEAQPRQRISVAPAAPSQPAEIESVDENPGCTSRQLATVCDLLPLDWKADLLGLTIEPVGQEAAGFRFYNSLDHMELNLAAEGWWPAGTPRPWVLDVAGHGPTRETRLELYGLGRPPGVRRLGYRWRPAGDARELSIYALRPGRYRVQLGRLAGAGGAPVSPPDGAAAARLRVRAPGARPGQLARLEVPEWVYQGRYPNFGGVFLRAAGERLPYSSSLSRFHVVADLEGVRPLATSNGHSLFDLRPWSDGPYLAAMQLTAPSSRAPLARAVVSASDGSPPGSPSAVAWECSPHTGLPCRLELPPGQLSRLPPRIWVLNGDNPPLEELGFTLWRAQRVVTFRWPRREPVWLEVQDSSSGELPAAAFGSGPRDVWFEAFVEPVAPARWPLWSALLLAVAALARVLARHPRLPRGRGSDQ